MNKLIVSLTPREKEVASYLSAGLTARQVSKKLKISVHTVEGYQRTIKGKLKSKTSWQSGYLLGQSHELSQIQI